MMNEIDRQMRMIQSLDPSAHLDFSRWTDKWYVSANVSVGGDGLLSSVTEHRGTPAEAVEAFLDRMKSLEKGMFLVCSPSGYRRHYRWNGVSFSEVMDTPS